MQRTSNFYDRKTMIDLKDAAFFLRLCETENVTRAAALSSVSPSTLSRTISKLEKDLGTTLCVRDQKGITITKSGKRFADYARKAIADFKALEADLKQENSTIGGSIKIYCSVTASYIFIPRLLSELRLSYPKLELRLETGDAAEALDHLKDPDTDFVISALPDNIPDNVNYVHLVSFPLVLIAPKTPAYRSLDLNDENPNLSKVPFIMPEKGQLKTEVDRFFKKQRIKPITYAEIAGHESIVSMTALGFGVSIVPKLVLDLSPFKNDVNILKTLPDTGFNVALCYLKDKTQDRTISAVTDLALKLSPTFAPDLNSRKVSEN